MIDATLKTSRGSAKTRIDPYTTLQAIALWGAGKLNFSMQSSFYVGVVENHDEPDATVVPSDQSMSLGEMVEEYDPPEPITLYIHPRGGGV